MSSAPSTTPRWDQLIWLVDSEVNMGLENPAERKHQKLTRSVARGVVDHDLKPNGNEKRSLASAIRLPPTRVLGAEYNVLLWKFRFSLRAESDALTKFLKCVGLGRRRRSESFVELMYQWAPIDPASALELLSPTFTNTDVRKYAVSVLSDAGDDELMGYLLQLVQARGTSRRTTASWRGSSLTAPSRTRCWRTFCTGTSSWSGKIQRSHLDLRTHTSFSRRLVDRQAWSVKNCGTLWRQSELMASLRPSRRELNGDGPRSA